MFPSGVLSLLLAGSVLAATALGQAIPQAESAPDIPPSPGTVRVAGIVLKWLRADKPQNYRRAEAMIRQAARGGAEIVSTTECFLDGYAIAEKTIPLETYRALHRLRPSGRVSGDRPSERVLKFKLGQLMGRRSGAAALATHTRNLYRIVRKHPKHPAS